MCAQVLKAIAVQDRSVTLKQGGLFRETLR